MKRSEQIDLLAHVTGVRISHAGGDPDQIEVILKDAFREVLSWPVDDGQPATVEELRGVVERTTPKVKAGIPASGVNTEDDDWRAQAKPKVKLSFKAKAKAKPKAKRKRR